MTPEQKAYQLILKHKEAICTNTIATSYGRIGPDYEYEMSQAAKQCALITVNQIIGLYDDGPYNYKTLDEGVEEYWKEVKQEIEKL